MRFWSLTGLTRYEDARLLQLKLVELRAQDSIPDTVLFLEHEPVVTQGRGLQFTGTPKPRHMPLPVLPAEIEFAESERGGDLTYHGPGQLVIYPIVKMDGQGFAPKQDITGFLRRFEGVLIEELAALGVHAESKKDAAGVWVGKGKVASIGIAVKKFVVYHGMAVNVTNDLKPFHLFSPCGFNPEVMTRLQDIIPDFIGSVGPGLWRAELEKRLAFRMGGGSRAELTCSEAFSQAMKEDPGLILASNPV